MDASRRCVGRIDNEDDGGDDDVDADVLVEGDRNGKGDESERVEEDDDELPDFPPNRKGSAKIISPCSVPIISGFQSFNTPPLIVKASSTPPLPSLKVRSASPLISLHPSPPNPFVA